MKAFASLACFATVALMLVAALACNKAEFTESPDGSIACNAGAHPFCAADAPTGCAVGPSESNELLKQLPQGTYARNCVANFVSTARDPGGDCVYNTCVCDPNPDGGDGAFWNCH